MTWKSFDLDQNHSKTSICSRWVTCRSRRSVSSSPQWNDETASPHTRSGWNVAIARLDINRSLPMDQHHNHNPSWKNQLMLPGWLGNPPKYRTNPFPGSISCRKNFSCSASGTHEMPEMPSTPLIFSRDWPLSYRITMNPREIEIVWSSKRKTLGQRHRLLRSRNQCLGGHWIDQWRWLKACFPGEKLWNRSDPSWHSILGNPGSQRLLWGEGRLDKTSNGYKSIPNEEFQPHMLHVRASLCTNTRGNYPKNTREKWRVTSNKWNTSQYSIQKVQCIMLY